MKSRLAASVAISALVVIGATGCTFISPQATTIQYSPSDGVSIPSSGPIDVRNAIVIVDEKGTTGNLVAGLANVGTKAATLNIDVAGLSDKLTVRVGAGEMLSLGGDGTPALRLDGIDTKPGATIKVYFQSGDGEGVSAQVPVLDGSLPYYADLVPSPEPTPLTTLTPTPAPTGTPAG